MVEQINSALEQLVGILWGLPLVIILVGSGLFFTFYLGGIQVKGFRHAIDLIRGKYDEPDDPGEINHFKALCAALSGTVGLGNIAGVAVAIKLGGPGATVWMILVGLVGMALKYSECSLAVMYRKIDDKGVVHGGPMYYIRDGLEGKLPAPIRYFLAGMFAVCTILACLGAACMFQANQVAASLQSSFDVEPLITGVAMMVFAAIVILGGIKRIGNVAGAIVPFMAAFYVIGTLGVVILNFEQIPAAFAQIFTDAFTGTAAAGGFSGAAFREVLIQGIRRAVFSSEAGLGSAAIAHSAVRTKEPVSEGVVALLEPFVDTVVICTITALAINITGVWTSDLTGVELTQAALDHTLPGVGTYFIPIAVALFAFSSIISWSYYGERSIDFLFGEKGIIPFKILFLACIVIGSIWAVAPILNFSDSAAALMVFPNVIALLFLAPVIKRATKDYFARLKSGEIKRHDDQEVIFSD